MSDCHQGCELSPVIYDWQGRAARRRRRASPRRRRRPPARPTSKRAMLPGTLARAMQFVASAKVQLQLTDDMTEQEHESLVGGGQALRV